MSTDTRKTQYYAYAIYINKSRFTKPLLHKITEKAILWGADVQDRNGILDVFFVRKNTGIKFDRTMPDADK